MPSDILTVSEKRAQFLEQEQPKDCRTMRSDAELVGQVRDGHIDAFDVLVERYEYLARASALRVVRNTHAADDIVQDAFVAAFESLESLRSPEKFGSWLLGILRRRAARFVRDDSRRSAMPMDTATDITADRPDGSVPDSIELLELVNQLPDHEKVVVGLRHFEGYAVADIAQIVGRPVGTVTKQLSRAHSQLRKWLGEEDKE